MQLQAAAASAVTGSVPSTRRRSSGGGSASRWLGGAAAGAAPAGATPSASQSHRKSSRWASLSSPVSLASSVGSARRRGSSRPRAPRCVAAASAVEPARGAALAAGRGEAGGLELGRERGALCGERDRRPAGDERGRAGEQRAGVDAAIPPSANVHAKTAPARLAAGGHTMRTPAVLVGPGRLIRRTFVAKRRTFVAKRRLFSTWGLCIMGRNSSGY